MTRGEQTRSDIRACLPSGVVSYLRFMPHLEFLLVLQCNSLVLSPHFLHDLGQVLAFRSIDVHVDANLGDLGAQLNNILSRGKQSGRDFLKGCRAYPIQKRLRHKQVAKAFGSVAVKSLVQIRPLQWLATGLD